MGKFGSTGKGEIKSALLCKKPTELPVGFFTD